MESYHAIRSCDHPASRIWLWIWNDVKSKIILILFLIFNNNLINKILKVLSNFYSTLIKDFLIHQSIRASRMWSPLTKSDRFHVDLLTTSIHIPPYLDTLYMTKSWMSINQKYRFIYIRFYNVSGQRITYTTPTIRKHLLTDK